MVGREIMLFLSGDGRSVGNIGGTTGLLVGRIIGMEGVLGPGTGFLTVVCDGDPFDFSITTCERTLIP